MIEFDDGDDVHVTHTEKSNSFFDDAPAICSHNLSDINFQFIKAVAQGLYCVWDCPLTIISHWQLTGH